MSLHGFLLGLSEEERASPSDSPCWQAELRVLASFSAHRWATGTKTAREVALQLALSSSGRGAEVVCPSSRACEGGQISL